MRIKFITSIAGERFSHKPGDEADWPDDAEAVRLIKAGHAVPVKVAGGKETAAARPGEETAETAGKPNVKGKRNRGEDDE